jgi:hypothetical protein
MPEIIGLIMIKDTITMMVVVKNAFGLMFFDMIDLP